MRTSTPRALSTRRENDAVALPIFLDSFDATVQSNVDAFLGEKFSQRLRDIRIFPFDQLRRALQHSDLAAKKPEHLSEFQCDITATQHDQMFRQLVQPLNTLAV